MLAAVLLVAALAGSAAETPAPYGPAVDDYKVSKADFAALEEALAGVAKAAPKLFPDGVADVDVILQDTSDFYIYSRGAYPYARVKTWGKYAVYRVRHRRPPEHETWGCASGPPTTMEVDDRRIIAERSIRCAPWGSFKRAQERKRSLYRFREAYLATLLHEFGHQYEDKKAMDPTPPMGEGWKRAEEAKLPASLDRSAVRREVFAELCEVRGSRLLYPAHAARLEKELAASKTRTEHDEALAIALDMLLRSRP